MSGVVRLAAAALALEPSVVGQWRPGSCLAGSRPSVSIRACSAGMRPGPLKAFGQVGNRIAPEGAPGINRWRGFYEGARNPPDLSVAVTGHLRGSGGAVPCPTPVLRPDARAMRRDPVASQEA